MYAQGRVKHVDPPPAELEDQMCDFGVNGLSDNTSPDRLDALVWAVTELTTPRGQAAGEDVVGSPKARTSSLGWRFAYLFYWRGHNR